MIDIIDKNYMRKKIVAKNGQFEQKANYVNKINKLHKAVERFKKTIGRNTQAPQLSLIVEQIWASFENSSKNKIA